MRPAVAGLLLLAACGDPMFVSNGAPAAIQVLLAPALADGEVIVVDAKIADPIWKEKPWLTVPLTGPGPKEVLLRAAHDGERLYLLVRWKDAERSMNRYWKHIGGRKWESHAGEDAFSICWSPGASRDAFREQGCALFCHDGTHRYQATRGIVDFWSWQAQQTRPHGQARDMVLRPGDMHRLRGDGQPENSDNLPNINEKGDAPRYVPFKRFVHDPVRDTRWLHKGNVQELPSEWKIDPKSNLGWEVPRDILQPMRGSRGDVIAVARFAQGVWILELTRRLDTTHDDDQPLGDPLVPALFSVALHDGTEGSKKAVSRPIELRFLASR